MEIGLAPVPDGSDHRESKSRADAAVASAAEPAASRAAEDA
jgi:hypothetical protein